MQRHDFAYDLPPELIAQTPLAERSASRLLVVDSADDLRARTSARAIANADLVSAVAPAATRIGDVSAAAVAVPSTSKNDAPTVSLRDCAMRDFPSLLRPGDLLVFNDTKVVAARLLGTKPSGGRVEIFLERVVAEAENEALVQLRASKPIREGLEVTTVGGIVRILGRQDDLWRVAFPGSALEFFEKWGDVPLPPYIQRASDANDRERYQSIFARERGAVAAPTASLHFDSELIRRIEEMGVSRTFVTLHVGAGTFQPMRVDDLDAHVMHAERVTVSAATCAAIEKTRAEGGRVIAVGTTVIRALESAALASVALGSAALRSAALAQSQPVGATAAAASESPAWQAAAAAGAAANTAASVVAATAPAARAATAAAAVEIAAVETAAVEAAAVEAAAVEAAAVEAAAAEAAAAETAAAEAAAAETAAAETGGDTDDAKAEMPSVAASPTGSRPCLPTAGWSGETRLFIRPGFRFQVADALLTNFHLPESTLLMLVCAFAGMTPVIQAYEHAVREKYRFFSYGDAMFLTRKSG